MYAISALVLLSILFYLSFISLKKPRKFPPGPPALPIIGSFYLLAPDVYVKIQPYFKKYGNIFHASIFNKNIVFLSGLKLIKDVYKDRGAQFSDRAFIGSALLVRPLPGFIDAPYGPKWIAHRKIFHTALRKLTIDRKGIEARILNELPYIEDVLKKHCDAKTLIDPGQLLDFASMNIMTSITVGNRFDYESPKFKKLIAAVHFFFKKVENSQDGFAFLYVIFPRLSNLWHSPNFKSVRHAFDQLLNYFQEEIDQHKTALDCNAPNDLIDHYLIAMKADTNNYLTENGLKMMLVDMFQGGIETTSSTLKWAILYMVNNPKIQERVNAEIKSVIGDGKFSYEDKARLPYCDATVLEVQRKATVSPLGVSHAPIKNETIAGYNIPKETLIFASFHSLHYSPEHWRNPTEFDPENFLDNYGRVGTREAFFPYGGGRRICLGIEIARMELFVFFVGIMQKFKFSLPSNSKLSEQCLPGITLNAIPYKVVIENNNT